MLSLNRRARDWYCRPCLERLEPRQVLAAAGFASLDDDGLLTVLGTNKKDRIDVSASGDQIVVSLNGKHQSFLAASVARLSIDGKSGDDCISVADEVLVDAVLLGGSGSDKLKGGGGNDELFGGSGHDRLEGGLGNDRLFGDSGDDKLSGGGGDDELDGGTGHDHLAGDAGNDSLAGGTGHDKLGGGDGDDFLLGGDGHDSISGDAGNDTLAGEAGHDKLKGGDGDDVLLGGTGHDEVHGDAGNDTLSGEAGHDKLKGGDGDDEFFGGDGHDEIFGDAGNDWLRGDAGHDKLRGGAGDDKLKGGAGNDELNGDEGVNLLDGDEGKNKLKNGDEFDFDAPPPDDFQPLAATLTAWNGHSTFSGFAVYERQNTPGGLETFLHVTVQGFTAGLFLPVFIDLDGAGPGESNWVGELEVDASGNGSLKLSTIVDEAGEQLLEFELATGVTIFIGEDLTGTFADA